MRVCETDDYIPHIHSQGPDGQAKPSLRMTIKEINMNKISIIGCGITGMITALSFANKGVKTSIYEKVKSEKFPPDVRTTTFTKAAKEFLEEEAIWKLFEKDYGIVRDIYIVDNKSPKMLHLRRGDQEERGFVVPNDFIKEELYRAVKKNKLIELHKGVEYKLNADDVILVCDGRGSNLAKSFDYRVNKSYKQCAIILVAEHELPHENVAVEHFMPKGPFASLPMKDPCQSSIVWTESEDVIEVFRKMPKAKLQDHLQEKMGEFLGKVKILGDVQIFLLSARVTKNYFKDNIVLVGDSAHGIHPLAGQGLNQGIKDIKALTEIFSKRLELGLDIDEIALEEYERARSFDNFTMFQMTDHLNRIFSNQIFPLAGLRKAGLAFLDEFGPLKKLISNYGSGLGI